MGDFEGDFDIPLYGDDGYLLPPPMMDHPVDRPPVEPESVRPSSGDCDRCRGKFVYKRKPVCKKCKEVPAKEVKKSEVKKVRKFKR